VNFAKLCIGHQSTIKRADDPTWETHKEIVRRGAYIGFDTVGHRMNSSFIPEREKIDMVLNAIDAGFEDQILPLLTLPIRRRSKRTGKTDSQPYCCSSYRNCATSG